MLLVNRLKPRAERLRSVVAGLIERHGKLVDTIDIDHTTPGMRLPAADIVATIGGDGTLLSTARLCLGTETAILGINAGKLGFMAEYDADTLTEDAPRVFGSDEPLDTQEIPTLLGVVRSGGGAERWRTEAVNEFVVTAGPPYRMISVALRFNGVDGPQVNGDGLIVCTPLGSTAYNVSAGGPIASPGSAGMIVTPIAAHSLAFRPLVIGRDTTVELELKRANDESRPGTELVADGQVSSPLARGDVVTVSPTGRAVRFVRNPRTSYWRTLVEKMGWGASPIGP